MFKGPLFGDEKKGISRTVNSRARQIQSKQNHYVSHRAFSKQEINQLYKSCFLSRNNAHGFLTRTVFSIWLVTGFRSTALTMTELNRFPKVKMRGDYVWKIKGTVGSLVGKSETHKGG